MGDKDIEIPVQGFWYPDEVGAAAGVAELECTTSDGLVIVHPRPRELTAAELVKLRAALAKAKPSAAEREVEWAALAAAAERARAERIAGFRLKAGAGKLNLADLYDVVLAIVGD